MNPWFALLVVPVVFGAIIPFVRWLVKSMVTDRMDAIEKASEKTDSKNSESIRRLGERTGELESWNVAHEAVEAERRRVREDTRGIPTVTEEGRKARGK